MAGRLLLVPNALDFGVPQGATQLADVLPLGVIRAAARLEHWVAENAKTTRAFLKRVEAVAPLARPLQDISIVELPRPPKGLHKVGAQQLQAAFARVASAWASLRNHAENPWS